MVYYEQNKISYQQLVMEQIKIIQNICSKELRDGDKTLKNALGEQVIEGEDTRYSFLQSVEVLGSMLYPYFGDMKSGDVKIEKMFQDFCDYYDLELVEVLDNKDFKKKIKEVFNKEIEEVKKKEGLQSQVNIFFLNDKIKEGRKIFRELIKVFKANDFLGNQSFGEGSGDIDEGTDAFVDEEQ